MKKLLFSIFTFLAFANGFSQIINPVKWTSKVEKLSDTEFNLVMEAKIDDEWHVYSQFTPADGPIPAEFKFKDAKGNFELVGKVKESPYKKQYNDIFEVDEYYFEKKATFTQKIKVINPKLTSIKASIDYQVCKEVCINQDNTFTFLLPKIEISATELPVQNVDTASIDTAKVVKEEPIKVIETTPSTEPKKEEEKAITEKSKNPQ